MINLFCLLGIYSAVFGCNYTQEVDFSKNEFDGLDKAISSLESQICENKNWKVCYKDWLIKSQTFGLDSILSDFNYQIFSNSFENDISEKLRNEIFSECKGYNLEDKREYSALCANINGEYIKFLTQLGQEERTVREYVDHIKSSGDYRAFPFLESFINLETKEFKKLNIQSNYLKIIASLHIIYTIESYYRRNHQSD